MPLLRRFSLLLLLLACGTPLASAREFDAKRDVFAFANDTAWAYGIDEAGQLHISRREKPAQFAHSCFVLARSVLQFHQFARFAPELPKVSREEYRRRVKTLGRFAVWGRGPRERVVIPGFADLHAFSRAYEGLLKENLGAWLPTYFRVGNYRMGFGHPRAGQAAAARWLAASMEGGRPRAVYLARFPKMNHVIVLHRVRRDAGGDLRFTAYDPNYPAEPTSLNYDARTRTFVFPRRWYFPGGPVNVMRVYLSPLH